MSMLLLPCMMESAMTIYEKKNYLKMMEKKMKGLDISSYTSMRWKRKYIRFVLKKVVFVDNNF